MGRSSVVHAPAGHGAPRSRRHHEPEAEAQVLRYRVASGRRGQQRAAGSSRVSWPSVEGSALVSIDSTASLAFANTGVLVRSSKVVAEQSLIRISASNSAGSK